MISVQGAAAAVCQFDPPGARGRALRPPWKILVPKPPEQVHAPRRKDNKAIELALKPGAAPRSRDHSPNPGQQPPKGPAHTASPPKAPEMAPAEEPANAPAKAKAAKFGEEPRRDCKPASIMECVAWLLALVLWVILMKSAICRPDQWIMFSSFYIVGIVLLAWALQPGCTAWGRLGRGQQNTGDQLTLGEGVQSCVVYAEVPRDLEAAEAVGAAELLPLDFKEATFVLVESGEQMDQIASLNYAQIRVTEDAAGNAASYEMVDETHPRGGE